MSAIDAFKANWQKIREAVKKRWGDKITDRDLDEVAGQREKLCHLLGYKCGLSEREANKELDNILDSITLRSSMP